jgi:alpha-mannosidase
MFHDAWPRKTGIHRHRLAFRYHEEPVSNLEAARFGWETAMPLAGTVVPANPDGTLPTSGSFLDVTGDVIVTALKPAHDGNRAVLRLYVPEADAVEFSIAGREPLTVNSLLECDLLEQPISPRIDDRGVIGVEPGGYAVGTYRLDIGRKEKGEGIE